MGAIMKRLGALLLVVVAVCLWAFMLLIIFVTSDF